jgi:SHS2 domain-containing protein
VHCEAPDDEILFVDWLNAVVFEMSSRHMVFSRFRVKVEGRTLRGTAWWGRGRAWTSPSAPPAMALDVP